MLAWPLLSVVLEYVFPLTLTVTFCFDKALLFAFNVTVYVSSSFGRIETEGAVILVAVLATAIFPLEDAFL